MSSWRSISAIHQWYVRTRSKANSVSVLFVPGEMRLTSPAHQSLLDDIINTINVLADRALDNVERLLLSLPPPKLGFKQSKKDSGKPTAVPSDEAAKLEIENGTHQLETLLNSAIDKNFDIFELYVMKNILTVKAQDRPFMQLSHYEGLDLATNNPDRPTLESVTALRRKLQASQKLHVVLEAERARNDALLRKLKSALGVMDGNNDIKEEQDAGTEESEDSKKPANSLGFLREKGNLEQGGTDRPITTTTEFTLSQLQALRSLSTTLRDILPKLGSEEIAPADAGDDPSSTSHDQKTWRRERAEYIESTSRKYLERSGGLELGQQGEVRDGEWQGGGRAFTRREVEGLENAVSILGASNAAAPGAAASAASATAHNADEDDVMDES